jgi:hypothetical protein
MGMNTLAIPPGPSPTRAWRFVLGALGLAGLDLCASEQYFRLWAVNSNSMVQPSRAQVRVIGISYERHAECWATLMAQDGFRARKPPAGRPIERATTPLNMCRYERRTERDIGPLWVGFGVGSS